jgi:hypothetical protein
MEVPNDNQQFLSISSEDLLKNSVKQVKIPLVATVTLPQPLTTVSAITSAAPNRLAQR